MKTNKAFQFHIETSWWWCQKAILLQYRGIFYRENAMLKSRTYFSRYLPQAQNRLVYSKYFSHKEHPLWMTGRIWLLVCLCLACNVCCVCVQCYWWLSLVVFLSLSYKVLCANIVRETMSDEQITRAIIEYTGIDPAMYRFGFNKVVIAHCPASSSCWLTHFFFSNKRIKYQALYLNVLMSKR